MCLITKQLEPIITTEDMVVWKRCYMQYGKLQAWFNDFEYIPHKLNKTKIVNTRKDSFFDTRARTVMENSIETDVSTALDDGILQSFGPGFHFATTKARFGMNARLSKFIVPAGSEVYYDDDELGITNQIIYSPK